MTTFAQQPCKVPFVPQEAQLQYPIVLCPSLSKYLCIFWSSWHTDLLWTRAFNNWFSFPQKLKSDEIFFAGVLWHCRRVLTVSSITWNSILEKEPFHFLKFFIRAPRPTSAFSVVAGVLSDFRSLLVAYSTQKEAEMSCSQVLCPKYVWKT